MQVLFELFMRSVMVAFHGSVLDRTVHAFDPRSGRGQALAVCPGVFDFGQAVIDVVFDANPVKDVRKSIFIAFAVCKLDAVIG